MVSGKGAGTTLHGPSPDRPGGRATPSRLKMFPLESLLHSGGAGHCPALALVERGAAPNWRGVALLYPP
eukprot:gene12384-biopygen6441